MNRQPPFLGSVLRRIACIGAAFLLVFVGSLPLFHSGHAAAAQVTNRSIEMSDSAPSGTSITSGVGSGTNVSYKVTFTTSGAADSFVLDFCTEDALIGDTCTFPTGMSFASATVTQVTGNMGTWTLTATAHGIKLADATANAATAAAGTQSFVIAGVTNPSSVSATTYGTFYGRMYTYANNTFGTYASPDTAGGGPGNYVDFGGVAMSINRVITITARVSEQLTYCLTLAAPSTWTTTHDCSDTVVSQPANYPALTLGHSPTAGSGAVLTADQTDTGVVYSQLSTNATSGAVVRMRNSNVINSCGGLSTDGGTTCGIPPVNGGANTGASAITPGTAAFGLFVTDSVDDTNGPGVGTLTPDPEYHDAAHSVAFGTTTGLSAVYFGMDTQTHTGTGEDVTTTYGSTVLTTGAPCYRVENQYVFGATAAITTPAGVYSANIVMIATGQF